MHKINYFDLEEITFYGAFAVLEKCSGENEFQPWEVNGDLT